MYLPRTSTILSISILALFLSSGNAHKEQEEQIEAAPLEDNSSNNLRGTSDSATTSAVEERSLLGRFLQFEDFPGFAFSTSCYTSCIAATSNSCADTPTPFYCRKRPPVNENAIGVRTECFQPGFVFYSDLDVKGGNMGPYENDDIDEVAKKCYYMAGEICKAFSTTKYMKVKDIEVDKLVAYEGDDDLKCRGVYVLVRD